MGATWRNGEWQRQYHAAEMGYKQFSYRNQTVPGNLFQAVPKGEIALFTTGFAEQSAFWSAMLDGIQRGFSQKGYHFATYRLQDDEIESLLLPGAFVREWTCGIIRVQVLDGRYRSMPCGMNIPILFVDSPVVALHGPLRADVLHTDNQSDIFRFVTVHIHSHGMGDSAVHLLSSRIPPCTFAPYTPRRA